MAEGQCSAQGSTEPPEPRQDGVPALAEVSAGARLLHYRAILDSFLAGDGAFVSDFYLAALGVDRAVVRELQNAWVWHRADGGFVPLESEATRVAVAVSNALEEALASPPRHDEPDGPHAGGSTHLRAVRDDDVPDGSSQDSDGEPT